MSVDVTEIPESEELVDSRSRINTNFSNLKTAADEQAAAMGGQFLGTAAIKTIAYNAQTVSEDITVPATANAYSCGPITINDGYTVTIEDGGLWQVF